MDPYASPAIETKQEDNRSTNDENNKLNGIGGWLILVAIGIVISPIRVAMTILTTYPSIFASGTWSQLTTPGSEHYNVLWAPIIIGEIVINSLQLLACLYLAYLFFAKKATFPYWYIGLSLFVTAFIVVDAFAVKLVLPEAPMFDLDTLKELVRSLISCMIWIPYMLSSRRVQATFTN
ncbi:DUF2569 domain-containing protein [Blastopirellula marina]|uniref:DUF2569 domain-containing protein n=1 Tax=Blastopirellula marina TaxID=124 RepID=A0A2S8FWN2_9BACT|nr:DUF2569 domain-containing protein [Blastopirellula marina]PQO36591.1 DUF2569 domain-containing protein [Blastopirellula marina]PTL44421.1 DUF2569 domain-containing protein [Blastopirellula marina]